MNDNQILQCKLSAFGACNKYGPDGALGGAFTKAVKLFQSKVMGLDDDSCDGLMSNDVSAAIDAMEQSVEADMHCKCGNCSGFGNGLYRDEYREGKAHVEAYYQYEYPGISLMTKWAAYGIMAMYPDAKWVLTCGYRCHEDNKAHGRSSTNHMGKAIDICPTIHTGDERATMCDNIRNELAATGAFQIGWSHTNKLALEPSHIAPTWVHLDCRCFNRKWIEDTIVS